MISNKKNQSMIITGESGAGKTESTKIVLRYLANIKKRGMGEQQKGDVEDKILYANPLLESFGNAKTVRNNNSSRFGKFIQIYFDQSGQIYSAEISNYLLEKSRITMQSQQERNYHIFHMLLTATPTALKDKYFIDSDEDYSYVNTGYSDVDAFEATDRELWQEMNSCLDGLKFTADEKDGIFRVAAAVLNLSRVQFGGDEEVSYVEKDQQATEAVCKLLGIESSHLQDLLCTKSILDPLSGNKIVQKLNLPSASINRETLSKIMYEKLFDWIVARVNLEIKKPMTGAAKNYKAIGILDIFGFEIFEVNSFEQLCINFTNEKLQQHFNNHMFKLEQTEYQEQGINCQNVEFKDNMEVINLVEKPPKCIFNFLDEQCKFRNGSDLAFVQKIKSEFKANKVFLPGPQIRQDLFGIAHFAGDVYYDVTNFVEKNKNSKNKSLESVMEASQVKFISELFKETQGDNKSSKDEQNRSISGQFKLQLEGLIKCLNESTSLYIRCIKPNNTMAPHTFDSKLVCIQLRCAGMLEAIRIRKIGFPIRRAFDDFVKNYSLLFRKSGIQEKNPREAVNKFIEMLDKKGEVKKKSHTLQVGKTKVFMKEHVKTHLDKMRESFLIKSILILQRRARRLVLPRIGIRRLIRARKHQAVLAITRFFRKLTARRRIKERITKTRLTKMVEEDRPTTAIQSINGMDLTGASESKKLMYERLLNINNLANHSDNPTPDISKILAWGEAEDNFMNSKEHTELLQENDRLRKELEQARCDSEHYKSESHRLQKQLQEKEILLKISRKQVEDKISELNAKNSELTKAKKSKQLSDIDKGIFEQIEQLKRNLELKNSENSTLMNRCNELKYNIQSMKESLPVLDMNNMNNRSMNSEKKPVLGENRGSSYNDSRSSHDDFRFSQLQLSTTILKEQSDCCKELVNDLVKLLKFKEFELRLLKKQYVDNTPMDQLQELISYLNKMKPEEKVVKERMQESFKTLTRLKLEEKDIEQSLLEVPL